MKKLKSRIKTKINNCIDFFAQSYDDVAPTVIPLLRKLNEDLTEMEEDLQKYYLLINSSIEEVEDQVRALDLDDSEYLCRVLAKLNGWLNGALDCYC